MKHNRGLCHFAINSEPTEKKQPLSHFLKDSLRRLPSRAGWAHFSLPVVVLCFLLGTGQAGLAQSTFGSVRGIAQDVSGAAVPDTKIVLHSTDENTDRTVNADTSGDFVFENEGGTLCALCFA